MICYVVDGTDPDMIERAKQCIRENVATLVMNDDYDPEVVDAEPGDTWADVNSFFIEEQEERREEEGWVRLLGGGKDK